MMEQSSLWARVEAETSIIAACLPTLMPLVRHFFTLDSRADSLDPVSPSEISKIRKDLEKIEPPSKLIKVEGQLNNSI